MINETFMRLDDWSLRFDPDAPVGVRQECRKYDQIVITESRIDGDLSRTDLCRTALFRGPILQRSEKMTDISGAGMEWFIGNAAGYGPITSWTFATARTWAQWVGRAVTDAAMGGLTVTAGIDIPATTYPDAGATDDGFDPKRIVTRQMLERVAARIGVEWDLTPDGNLRAVGAGSGNYWVGGSGGTFDTPLVVVMRGHEGRDIDLIGLEVIDIDREEDATRNAYRAIVYGAGMAYLGVEEDAYDPERFTYNADGSGAFADWVAVESGLDTDPDCAAAAAENFAASAPINNYRATVRDWYPGRWVKPGDYVWAFDDICEISAPSPDGILYRGEFVAADTLRCYGMRWAIREGMGVYRLTRGDPATYETTRTEVLDITDYVLPEDGDCELTIGSPEQSIADILGLS